MSATLTDPRTDATAEASFSALGTTCRVLTTDPEQLAPSLAMARHHLAELDRAASRFRPDSEVMRLAERAATAPATHFASFELADYLRAALEMAQLTDGLVDPTVGRAVVANGYDADIQAIRDQPDAARGGDVADVPGWQQVSIDDLGMVWVPAGTLIDLGATAKAHAADTIARRLAARLPGGFLVNLGGDIAISGEVPDDGWNIGVQLADGREAQVVRSTGAAVCTSSTQLRTWRGADGTAHHHIIDPRTGRVAPTTWASVTCVAPSAIVANAMATAAIVLGDEAPAWLQRKGVMARLDAVDGTTVFVGGWPEPTA